MWDLLNVDYPIRRLGIEGLIMFKGEPKYDADNYRLTLPSTNNEDVTIAVFDKVVVQVEVEKDRNTQRGKVKMTLVNPPVTQTL
jgi:exosome complex exonuclease DIS3/RRP44